MRTALFMLLCTGLGLNPLSAQKLKESEVPAKVRETYKKRYPAVRDGKWEKEGTNYAVAMIANKKQTSVIYDEKGKLIETETVLKVSELPKMVTDFIVANFRGKNPTRSSRVTDARGKITYKVTIDHLDYIFDEPGNFLNQQQEKLESAGESE